MKKTLFIAFAAVATLGFLNTAHAQLLDISEVYGGGGNTGSTYKNDFIELYNRGTTAIDLSTYSVYYGAATGTAFTATGSTPLTGSIAAGAFYLIQESAGTGGTTALPTPNATGTLAISGTTGRVALALTSTVPTNATSAGVIDFIGWGPTASQFEGTGPGPATTNPTSVDRANPAVDTNDNAADFSLGSPSPGAAFIAAPAPEPSTYAFVVVGLGALVLVSRHRRVA